MQLLIHSRDSEETRLLRPSIQEKLSEVLDRFRPTVTRATVYLADQNGPRGGIDKQCRIVVKLRRHGEVTVKERSSSWFDALSGAVERLRNSIDRKLAKWRTRRDRPDGKGVATEEI